jgi:hypothetical protein
MRTNSITSIFFALAVAAAGLSSQTCGAAQIQDGRKDDGRKGANRSPGKGGVLLYKTFETVLEPGIWHGFPLGPSSDACVYVAKIIPLEPAKDGSYIEKTVVQPESDGKRWTDVLRVMIPSAQEKLKVRVLVYKVSDESG